MTDFSSEIFKSALDLAPDAISIINLDGRVLYANPAYTGLTGYRVDELTDIPVMELPFLDPDNKEQFKLRFESALNGQNSDPVETEVITREGNAIWVETRFVLLPSTGNHSLVQTISRDIGERKKIDKINSQHLIFEHIVSRLSSMFINMPDEKIDSGIENVLKELSEFIGAVRGGIYLLSEDRSRISNTHEWCMEPESCQKALIQDIPAGFFEYTSHNLSILNDVIICSPEGLQESPSAEAEWFSKHGFHPLFFVPIISEESLVGTLGFYGEKNSSFNWPVHFSNLLRFTGNILYSALERKEISRNLRFSQITLNQYSHFVYWLTQDGSIIDVNPAACEFLGYNREELLAMHVYDFDPSYPKNPEDAEKLWNHIKKLKNNTRDSIHIDRNGEKNPVEITANFIEFEGMEYVCALAHDVSERRKAERVIRDSEEQYRRLFENTMDIFYEASLDGIMLNVTPSVERHTKYKREELIGKPMILFYNDPEVRGPLLKKLREYGFVYDYEIEIKDSDGTTIMGNLSSRIIRNERGEPDRIVGSISNITDRKKAQEKVLQLSTALEQSPVPVLITDLEGKLIFVNHSFVNFSNLQPEEIYGKTPEELTMGQLTVSKNQKMWKRIGSGKIWKEELDYLTRDKKHIWIALTVSPVINGEGNTTNYVVVLEDITNRKSYEETLMRAKEKAEESDRLKSAFLANMSHEIRTPMNAILGFSSLLKEEKSSSDQQDYYIDIINSKGRDLLRIISDIIDISRIEAGDLNIKMEPVDIYGFTRTIFDEFKGDTLLRSKKDIQFRISLPEPESKIILNTDPARLKQVFVNLFQNAVKFTTEGFIELGFSLIDKNTIRLFVRDSGIGIPEDKLEIIFERFRQIDDSHTREIGGTGLGLAISTSLVKHMGGELKVKSRIKQGSEFFFDLKFIALTAPENSENKQKKISAKPQISLSGKSILVVEDDYASYLLLESFLKKLEANVLWARDGKYAIELLNSGKKVHMVLMDIRMPELNGLETTRIIRKTHPDLPIIAQTAYAQISDRIEALANGCNDYLSKPVSPVELRSILEKYL